MKLLFEQVLTQSLGKVLANLIKKLLIRQIVKPQVVRMYLITSNLSTINYPQKKLLEVLYKIILVSKFITILFIISASADSNMTPSIPSDRRNYQQGQ